LNKQVARLESKLEKVTPQNSSLPPSTQQNRVSDALSEPYEELRSELQNQEQLFVDESPTKQNQRKAWLWVAVAPCFTLFGIFRSSKRAALQVLIGNYSGIIINCDRAKMYFHGQRLQWCWAHLTASERKAHRAAALSSGC